MSAYDDDPAADGSPALLDESFVAPPTYAAFSPVTLSANTPSRSSRRSTVLVHQKSPLLLATPPQITRALAYSHPFLLPLNTFVGLLTWSTGDPWQSFLFLSAFWFSVLYGDTILMRAGPVAVGISIIAAMYGRRYSPLSSSGWRKPGKPNKNKSSTTAPLSNADGEPGASHAASKPKKQEDSSTKHQKTLDEIVETLKEFTGRCNALMEPMLEMTDFLSTQRTATSATTRPALTAMFMRLLIVTPFWFALTMPPLRIITVRRVVLVVGTIALTWHARVMRVCRTILWRSKTVRRFAAAVTGLRFDTHGKNAAAAQLQAAQHGHRRNDSTRSAKSSGVKFTFIIYENQRRWIGLGWTHSLFAYERATWTDEHNNSLPSKDDFELPHVDDGSRMEWQWTEGSRWRVDGVADEHGAVDYDGSPGRNGWIYYDTKWNHGRRGVDGWGKWTRRRKWYRDAELVEVEKPDHRQAAVKDDASLYSKSDSASVANIPTIVEDEKTDDANVRLIDDNASVYSTSSKSSFWPPMLRRRATDRTAADKEKEKREARGKRATEGQDSGPDTSGLGIEVEMELQRQGKDGGQWGIGDDARMNLE
ncbi:hypothetical protein LLEC1_07740 [Akanthomyces lecanii]|uniref:Peroxin/Ferlin domain-containing protein n=1 Tax=Cordyceps confragosa TaxID=2714763 RepID=A0A179IK88_CORDF|nr:hypothetical protein LLEC1_07740 [Akanthomyces lecanii]